MQEENFMNFHVIIKALREALIKSRYAECDERTENLRKCVRSEETCPKGALEAYSRTLEEPLGQRFAGDDVFYQCFLSNKKTGASGKGFRTRRFV